MTVLAMSLEDMMKLAVSDTVSERVSVTGELSLASSARMLLDRM